MTNPSQPTPRRSFLSRVQKGAASLAALAMGNAALAGTKTKLTSVKATARFEPARHEKDDWFDEVPGKHRLVFDTTGADGFGEALVFANNFLIANRDDYGLANADMALVIIARHKSTPFAYNDAMWAKYGAALTPLTGFNDPLTKQAPIVNVFNSTERRPGLSSRGTTIDSLTRQGVRFAVCSMATRGLAGLLAKGAGMTEDAVFQELTSNLTPNARMVPAGIVAVNRAQERGYTLVNT